MSPVIITPPDPRPPVSSIRLPAPTPPPPSQPSGRDYLPPPAPGGLKGHLLDRYL
jgi:hypothetical protein